MRRVAQRLSRRRPLVTRAPAASPDLSLVRTPTDPERWADAILVELAKGYSTLDRLDVCETPAVESSLDYPEPGDLAGLVDWLDIVTVGRTS